MVRVGVRTMKLKLRGGSEVAWDYFIPLILPPVIMKVQILVLSEVIEKWFFRFLREACFPKLLKNFFYKAPQHCTQYPCDAQQDIAQHPGAAAQEGTLPIRGASEQELRVTLYFCHHDHILVRFIRFCNPDGIPVPERYITESCA